MELRVLVHNLEKHARGRELGQTVPLLLHEQVNRHQRENEGHFGRLDHRSASQIPPDA